MKTKACALIMAIIMLFSFICTAENGYVTIADPYYTDGTNEYDLTGLSVNLSFAKAEALMQFILRVVTNAGTVAAGAEIDEDEVGLFADGFSSRYTLSGEDFHLMIQEALDLDQSLTQVLTANIDAESALEIALCDMVKDVYNGIYANGQKLTDAKTTTVDTFLHTGMSAFVVPLNTTAEEIDEILIPFVKALDEQESFRDILKDYASEVSYNVNNDDSAGETVTAVLLYEKEIQPLGLNVMGNAYYGENDIFIEWNLMKGDEVALPVYLEVTNTENPSLYMNVLAGDEYVLYATIEASEDGLSDYLEIGVLSGERTIALVTYQVYMNENMPIYDLYVGLTKGNELYNFSFVNATDQETARNIHLSAYLDGIEAQLSYTGTITSDYGDRNEQGVIQLATNLGIMAKANVGFGHGSGNPTSFIPEGIEKKDIASMTDEENQSLMEEIRSLLDAIMNTIETGVPGLQKDLETEDAQG